MVVTSELLLFFSTGFPLWCEFPSLLMLRYWDNGRHNLAPVELWKLCCFDLSLCSEFTGAVALLPGPLVELRPVDSKDPPQEYTGWLSDSSHDRPELSDGGGAGDDYDCAEERRWSEESWRSAG